jgi:hypothetical protein
MNRRTLRVIARRTTSILIPHLIPLIMSLGIIIAFFITGTGNNNVGYSTGGCSRILFGTGS